MPNCSIINCTNSTKTVNRGRNDISFHCFPKDPILKEKWMDATGNKNWFPNEHSRICSIHFKTDDFCGTDQRRRLSKTAIPTIQVLQMMTQEEDFNQPDTLNEEAPLSASKKWKILNKLIVAQKKLKQKEALIKRLREENRDKANRIQALVAQVEILKKEYCVNDEHLNTLKSIKVEVEVEVIPKEEPPEEPEDEQLEY